MRSAPRPGGPPAGRPAASASSSRASAGSRSSVSTTSAGRRTLPANPPWVRTSILIPSGCPRPPTPSRTACAWSEPGPKRWRAARWVMRANWRNVAVGVRSGLRSASYQMLPGRLPRPAAEAGGEQVERPVRDARVDVHAAVVLERAHVVAHVAGLRVLAEPRVVVGGAGRLHRAQRVALELLAAQVGADQPVRLGGGVAELALLDHDPGDVRHVLVQRAGLALVLERRLVLDHAVAELVADHVERLREAREDLAVAVAEHHPAAVPERVRVLLAVVHDAAQRHVLVVDRVAAEDVLPEVPGLPEAVERLVGRRVAGRLVVLVAHAPARRSPPTRARRPRSRGCGRRERRRRACRSPRAGPCGRAPSCSRRAPGGSSRRPTACAAPSCAGARCRAWRRG